MQEELKMMKKPQEDDRKWSREPLIKSSIRVIAASNDI